MILRQVDRLGGMVEEVLDFARGETRLKIKLAPLQDSLELLKENNLEVLARAGISLVIKPVRLTLPLDADRFQRVIQNLVSNSHEALARRKGGRILVSARREGRQCIITVADNGPGIPKEIRASVFEPFVSQGKVNGTGLGLAIAKAVVEAHGGSIDFTSSRRGTSFSVHLPLG
jgi:signal transduction histidine kinase